MSSITETGTELVREDSTVAEGVAAATSGVGVLLFVLGWVGLFEVVQPANPLGPALLHDWYGLLMLLGGVAVVGLGVASRLGYTATEPSATAGLTTGVAFALIGFVAFALTLSQTFGLDGPQGLFWILPSLVGAAGTFAVTALPREDIGSTLTTGTLAILVGLVVLTGVISPQWEWALRGEWEPTFPAGIVVPVLSIVVGLLITWAAAKARAGFGARGRQDGAFLLASLNALAMIAVLVVLIGFILFRGADGLVRGAEFGLGVGPQVFGLFALPVDLPFVMRGVSLRGVNGIFPAVIGTVWLVIGAMLVSVPIGVGAAVFLTEYAERGRFTMVVETATNGLWSTPSIVYGLFGLAFFIPRFGNQQSLLAGQLVLGFMMLPLVIITSREALKSVPDGYRDASAALGVTQWQTIRSVVLPAALPGVATGVILGVGRIAGETAPILLVTSSTKSPFPQTFPRVLQGFQFTAQPPFISNPELLQASSALPYQLFALITAGVGTGGGGSRIDPWATALVLLLVVLSFYAVGIVTRNYFRSKLRA
jgi:phosphate transport system permease protein